MKKQIMSSSIIYRMFSIGIDVIVISFILEIVGIVNAVLIAGVINLIKIGTYYIYHNVFMNYMKGHIANER